MVGGDLRIRRFTPMAGKVLNLIAHRRRPAHRRHQAAGSTFPTWRRSSAEVIDTVSRGSARSATGEGRWYSLRVHPYRTLDNKIDGAVIVLVDIDQRKRAGRR